MFVNFNARSSMLDQQGKTSYGNDMEETLGDVVFNPITTPALSSAQTRHKHCGALLTTQKQAQTCQRSSHT